MNKLYLNLFIVIYFRLKDYQPKNHPSSGLGIRTLGKDYNVLNIKYVPVSLIYRKITSKIISFFFWKTTTDLT